MVHASDPRQKNRFLSQTVATLWALGILAGSTLVAFLFLYLGSSDADLVMAYLIGVVFVTLRSGRILGSVASIVSVVLFNFLFVEPRFTFLVHDTQYLFTFAVMLAVSLITSALTGKIARQSEDAAERERRTSVLYRISKSLLTASGVAAIRRVALETMEEILPGWASIFLSSAEFKTACAHDGDDTEEAFTLEHMPDEFAEAGRTLLGGVGSGNSLLLASGILCVPLAGAGRTLGLLIYVPRDDQRPIDQEERTLVEALAAQLALAFDRELVSARHEEAKFRAEREKLRVTILRSISHDLRTPLAGIAGASSALLENAEGLDERTSRDMLAMIYEESTWLSELVENLLSLSRIQSSGGGLQKAPELLDDVLVSAVQRMRKRLEGKAISVKGPEELVLVPMDGTLIEQVLINLIDNAVRHTPAGTKIVVAARIVETQEGSAAEFSVQDDGPGIPDILMPTLFDAYKPSSGESERSRRGAGIGLGICRAIVEAHGGHIAVENLPESGARVCFTIPSGDVAAEGPEESGKEVSR